MKVVVAGASGFIGARLVAALLARGHEVVGVARGDPPAGAWVASLWLRADVAAMRADDWRDALSGSPVVVNCIGIFRETRTASFHTLHVDAARTLHAACVRQRVARVVQLSALGADEGAATAYHRSKRAADEALLALPLNAVVVQPSLVFGAGGASAGLFLQLAALPLLALPGGGRQPLQPVHVDDVVDALVALVEHPRDGRDGTRVPFVGPAPLTWHEYLIALRRGLQLPPARAIRIPARLMAAAARVGDRVPGLLLDTASWSMLQRGNTASAAAIAALLQRPPRPADEFVPREAAAAWRTAARLPPWLALLRLTIAAVWIVTGIVSAFVYPERESYALLARSGVPAAWQPLALYGAAALDVLLGLATLVLPRRRLLWACQAPLIAAYTAIITWRLPEFWWHPYGPLTKNLPMLAAIGLLAALEAPRRRWTT